MSTKTGQVYFDPNVGYYTLQTATPEQMDNRSDPNLVRNPNYSPIMYYATGVNNRYLYKTPTTPINSSEYGANLNQAPRVDFNNLGTRVGPSIADIYGPMAGNNMGGAGINYGGFQRSAPRPPGFMPQFNMQQVMQNIAARRAMQPQPQGITALPMGQGLNGAPGPAGIAGLQAIAKGPTP